jgi:hypothetical protein
MKRNIFYAIMIILLISVSSSCGQPDRGQVVGSPVNFSGSKKVTLTPEWKKPGVYGKGKISFVFYFQEGSPSGTFTITDTGSSNFIIKEKMDNKVAVFNEYSIEGDGKLKSSFSGVFTKCTMESTTDGLIVMSGTMTGGFDKSNKNSCEMDMKFDIFFGPRGAILSNCPKSYAVIDPVNYSFSKKFPPVKGLMSPAKIPETSWQLVSMKIEELVLDEEYVGGCKVTLAKK